MTTIPTTPTRKSSDGSGPRSRATGLATRLAIELAIGVGVAAVLVVVGWASSNAIRFVYGGY